MKDRLKYYLLFITPNFIKPRITGTWEEIVKQVNQFSSDPRMGNTNGYLIKFIGVTKFHTPYIFTKSNEGKLLFRKRDNCFMIPGDCGTYDLSDSWNKKFSLIEIPKNCWLINIKKLRHYYNVGLSQKPQHEYY